MDKLVKRIIDTISDTNDIYLLDELNKIKIELENFHDIYPIKSEKTISFVDGGNMEILRAPSLSVFFNRVYSCTYKKNLRISNKRIEFYSLITPVLKDKRLFYKTECFGNKMKEYLFDAYDKRLSVNNKKASISIIGDALRRLSELDMASNLKSDFVIIDGTLDQVYPFEEEFDKTNLFGLSKTSEILTEKGNTASAALNRLSDKQTWYYDAGRMIFLKLHSKSKHVFRFEGRKDKEILGMLAKNSTDPVFLGYPYGFIESDRFARVSNKEKQMLELQLKMRLKKDSKKIEFGLSSLDAHEILDNIS